MLAITLSKSSKKILIDIYKTFKSQKTNDFEFSYTKKLCEKFKEDDVYNSLALFKDYKFIKLYTDFGFRLEEFGISTAENLLFGNRFKIWVLNNILAILALIVSVLGLFLPK